MHGWCGNGAGALCGREVRCPRREPRTSNTAGFPGTHCGGYGVVVQPLEASADARAPTGLDSHHNHQLSVPPKRQARRSGKLRRARAQDCLGGFCRSKTAAAETGERSTLP
ncbi:hypothetical protein SAV14893_000170 [Streptomyces avermitilis]|uniref:Uncharacterized protein n=1 Tax=Streptomyces avermitilis TaxID=33903 RepID=A0A4D4N427_STRAX|nr:hypothetical protein SAV14893_000170 [Streptomyces avermitilis]GDY79301.1 hypothetical protein SAV31267_087860 [Streptomyces avermitilis]